MEQGITMYIIQCRLMLPYHFIDVVMKVYLRVHSQEKT